MSNDEQAKINMRSDSPWHINVGPLEVALIQAFDAAELDVPVYDGDPPTVENVEAFLKALDDLGYRVLPKDSSETIIPRDMTLTSVSGAGPKTYPIKGGPITLKAGQSIELGLIEDGEAVVRIIDG